MAVHFKFTNVTFLENPIVIRPYVSYTLHGAGTGVVLYTNPPPPIISGPRPENNGPPPSTLGPKVELCWLLPLTLVPSADMHLSPSTFSPDRNIFN